MPRTGDRRAGTARRMEPGPRAPGAPDDAAWAAVIARDRAADGAFVFAVRTTGIYCRPSCPARRPRREHVALFRTPDDAEREGFRACRRCRPRAAWRTRAERAVRRAVRHIDTHEDEPIRLRELAREVGLSPFHLQRTFTELVGLSPKAYQTARRLDRLKARLKEGDTVSRATYEAGFGSTRGAYAGARAGLGMTPGAYRRGGRGERIAYAVVPSPVGRVLVAATERGVCAVMFGTEDATLEGELRREFPEATLARDDGTADGALGRWVDAVSRQLAGVPPGDAVPLDLRGTAFQQQVWQALRDIPAGETRTYGAIAAALGTPGGARAVGEACAANRVALLVPCHRVVRADGTLGGYRWDVARKQRLLEHERA